MRLLPGDYPQLDSHTLGLRTDPYDRGDYPDEERSRVEGRADLHWLAVPLTLLAAPLFILAEWWRRVRRG